ncbi:MAG: hypothetical protein WCA63_05335 [Gallionella sp.]
MVYIRTLIAVFLLLPSAAAYAADWQYAGIVGKDKASFFDAADIQYPDKDTVRLWVKDISEKTIKHYFNSKDRDQIIDESARKIASGYIPDFLKLESTKRTLPDDFKMQDALATMVSDEIIANKADVQATTSTYFEIDCKGKRIAPLTIIKYRRNGSIAKSQTPQQAKYFYIVPDSSGDWLSMLVCPKS